MEFMRKFIKFVLPVGLVVMAVLIVMALGQMAKNRRPDMKAQAQPALVVEVMPATVSTQNLLVYSQGSVEPRTETTLVAEVSGTIVSVSSAFVAGGFFRLGETVLQIDPSDYLTAQKSAQANLASRQAQLSDQKARADQALKDWKNLGRGGEPSDLVLRKPQLAEARANVLAAEADLQKAERDLERTRIKLPYDGLVREKKVDIGQFVAPGTALGITFSVNTAEVRLPLSAADLSFLNLPSSIPGANQAGPQALAQSRPQVLLEADSSGEPGQWNAEIIRTEGVLDTKSRVTYAVAEVVDPYGILGKQRRTPLRIGTFVRAEIIGNYVKDVVVLPRKVLRNDNTVLIANAENELEVREVTVLRKEARKVYITGGLETGDLVITSSVNAPIPGMRLMLDGQVTDKIELGGNNSELEDAALSDTRETGL
jgi:RND family efflux transporter MFP subunit